MGQVTACHSSSATLLHTADYTTVVHLFQPDWIESTLSYRIYQDDPEFHSLSMRREDENWWVVSLEANRLEFAFMGDTGVINLGGAGGCYPEDHFSCPEDTYFAQNFRASAAEIWVQDGVVFTSHPGSDGVADQLTVLSLNLHTYQEFQTAGVAESELTDTQAQQRVDMYGPLFDRVAAAINTLDPDLICLQEVGEWSGGIVSESANVEFGATESNMVHQILRRLDYRHYAYTMDWSHYGFDVWLEGSAILSKVPFSNTASRFISSPQNSAPTFWKSRNVPMAQIELPDFGEVRVFSVHAGWWDDEQETFQSQFDRLTSWAEEAETPGSTTVFCGDFNLTAGSKRQQFMTNDTGYSDQYALANPDGLLDLTVGGDIDGWRAAGAGRRIDYILMNDDSPMQVRQSQRIFTQNVFGRVSDHTGVYAQFGRRESSAEAADGVAGLQLYLSGTHSGHQAMRGFRFELIENGNYVLTTRLGAAILAPGKGLLPHRLLITDHSGARLSLGSAIMDGKNIVLGETLSLSEGRNFLNLSVAEPGLFRFELDYEALTLVIQRLQ